MRSNYFYPESARLYELSLRLYEGLSREIGFNIMLSQRGIVTLAHDTHQLEMLARWLNAMQLNGIDGQLLSPAEVRQWLPLLNDSPTARYPVKGGLVQRRGGVARHDAVAWGYARVADALGVDIIQNCEVIGFLREGDRVVGVETTRGQMRAPKVALAVAGHSSVLAAKAGFRLPVTSYALQAFVTEPLKPVLSCGGAFHGHGDLCEPVRQGRARDRRRARPLPLLRPARQPADPPGYGRGTSRALPLLQPLADRPILPPNRNHDACRLPRMPSLPSSPFPLSPKTS